MAGVLRESMESLTFFCHQYATNKKPAGGVASGPDNLVGPILGQ
jgi:hypothetical protein